MEQRCDVVGEGGKRQMGRWADGPLIARRFLDIVVGSLAELAYIFRLAKELEMIEASRWNELDQARDKTGQLTWGLYRSVRRMAST